MTLMTEGTQSDSTASQAGDKAAASAAAGDTATPQGTTEGQKTGSEQKDESKGKAPESYEDFKFADDQTLPEGLGDEIKSLAKDLNLSQEQAQKLAEFELKRTASDAESQKAHLEKLSSEWVTAAKTDKEFGGEKLTANLAVAKRGLDSFASPELKALLDASGFGNHPEVIRMFFKVGTQISADGTFVGGNKGNEAPGYTPFEKAANTMYPNQR